MAESLATNWDSRSCTGATSLHGGSACEVYGLRHRGHDVGRSGGLLSSKAKTQNLAHLMEVDQSERWGLAALRGKGFCSVHFEFHIFGNLDQSQCRPGYSPFQYPLACSMHACTCMQLALQLVPLSRVRPTVLAHKRIRKSKLYLDPKFSKLSLLRRTGATLEKPLARQCYIMVYSCLSKAQRHVSFSKCLSTVAIHTNHTCYRYSIFLLY